MGVNKKVTSVDLMGMCPLQKVTGLEKFSDYFVDVLGNVWSTKGKRLHKLSPGQTRKKCGYLFVMLTDNEGNLKKFLVHRLIAKTFVEGEEPGSEVNHKNRNSFDNRVENLEWCNREENMCHLLATRGTTLDEKVVEKVKKLHSGLQSWGVELPDLHCFLGAILEGEIDRLAAEFGLRV